MRIAVPDAARGRGATSAIGDRLVAGFGAERVSLKRPEVDVEIARDSDRGVLRVLDAVERWIDQAGVGFAELGLGDRSYRLAPGAPIASVQ
jgi:hypothetical protein